MSESIPAVLIDYSLEHSTPESEHTRWISEATTERLLYDDMLSGPHVGGLLRFLVKISSAKRILEIGTFTGYATLTMAESLPEDGTIDTLEMNLKYLKIAREGFERSGISHKINIIEGNSRNTVLTLEPGYDIVFIDADKDHYPEYFKSAKKLLSNGGILIADNVFWQGGVLHPSDRKSRAIHRFNQLVANDPEFENVMLPVRDGILLARKK